MKKELTQSELKELLHYDPETGVFTRLKPRTGPKTLNNIAGTKLTELSGKTYVKACVGGKTRAMHRLAWVYVHGYAPLEIDHINGDGTDNRIINLREVNRTQNNRNARLRKDNKSGIRGVSWDKYSNKWHVRICSSGVEVSLGFFTHLFDAACARKNAENEYGYHENHGQDRPL